MNKKLHVKKDDTVLIISGDDRGKKGKVLEVSPKEGKVIVEGRNIESMLSPQDGRSRNYRVIGATCILVLISASPIQPPASVMYRRWNKVAFAGARRKPVRRLM